MHVLVPRHTRYRRTYVHACTDVHATVRLQTLSDRGVCAHACRVRHSTSPFNDVACVCPCVVQLHVVVSEAKNVVKER